MSPRYLLEVALALWCFTGMFDSMTRAGAQTPVQPQAPDPQLHSRVKVPLAFNRLYDYPALTEALKALAAGHPDLLTLKPIGKSVEGRDLWCLTINNPRTGTDITKPAMYVDGNIHGNEVQAAETSLYLAWFLAENYGRLDKVTKLIDRHAFYIVPTVNPDGRFHWFNNPNTTHSSRSGKNPFDDDRDGRSDEDGFDDLDGDGQITQMRRADPKGRWKPSPDDPLRLIPAEPGEDGSYELLGMEGVDNDGDGRINEDPPGGYDMNRNFPADWQPNHIQGGAGPYPLSWPETMAVANFIRAHPNIAGVQAFHNNGGMILRGPGHPSRQDEYPGSDDQIASEIGVAGEKMLPYYKSIVIHKDLYPVRGGFIGWTYEHLGIFSFTNELYNSGQLLGELEQAGKPGSGRSEKESERAKDRLTLGADVVAWHPVKHPLYGEIEVGGLVKHSQRVPPSFLLEELCHRNAAFVMYHAEQMPLVAWQDLLIQKIGPDTTAVTIALRNTGLIPTRSAQAARRKLGRPDEVRFEGTGLTVMASGRLIDRYTGELETSEGPVSRIRLESGVGNSPVFIRWIVRGHGNATLTFEAEKAAMLTRQIAIP